MKRLVSTLAGVCLFLALGVAASLAADAGSPGGAAVTEHALRVEFADAHGRPQHTAYFSVKAAYPGMPSESAVVTLHNRGSADVAGFDIAVMSLTQHEGPRLADVLRATVIAQETQETVYRGPLVGLRFDGAGELPAGDSVSYVVALDWPEGGASDNAYQGLVLEFELKARARR